MTIKFINPFTNQRNFRDITSERQDVVKIASSDLPDDAVTKVYECKETRIIHSKTANSNHASISNSKGFGYVQEWELRYVVEHILKEDYEKVCMLVGGNGVIHLYPKHAV